LDRLVQALDGRLFEAEAFEAGSLLACAHMLATVVQERRHCRPYR
jgi:hypothetical protein